MWRMSLRSQARRKLLTPLFAKRTVAACVLVFFCLQFSRFYLIIQLDGFICLEPNHLRTTDSLSAHDHPHDGEEALAHSPDDGYSFQHCKDTFDGIALTPVQPLGLSVAAPVPQPETAWASRMPENQPAIDNVLSPPFQPPRS